jgi:hypothetical protein
VDSRAPHATYPIMARHRDLAETERRLITPGCRCLVGRSTPCPSSTEVSLVADSVTRGGFVGSTLMVSTVARAAATFQGLSAGWPLH